MFPPLVQPERAGCHAGHVVASRQAAVSRSHRRCRAAPGAIAPIGPALPCPNSQRRGGPVAPVLVPILVPVPVPRLAGARLCCGSGPVPVPVQEGASLPLPVPLHVPAPVAVPVLEPVPPRYPVTGLVSVPAPMLGSRRFRGSGTRPDPRVGAAGRAVLVLTWRLGSGAVPVLAPGFRRRLCCRAKCPSWWRCRTAATQQGVPARGQQHPSHGAASHRRL